MSEIQYRTEFGETHSRGLDLIKIKIKNRTFK